MRKVIKVPFIILLFLIIILFLGFTQNKSLAIRYFHNKTRGQKFIKDLKENKNEENNIKKIPYKIQLMFRNNELKLKSDILYKNNRIYIPLEDFLNEISYRKEENDKIIRINNNSVIDIEEKCFYKNKIRTFLREDIFIENKNHYISFFDLCEILDFNTLWNYDNNKIYINNKLENLNKKNKEMKEYKRAYIRFEDFVAGDVYLAEGSLEKIRLVSDFMSEENESFSISWIPRYINNDLHIDNDIYRDENMKNANFIFTLDYIINRGGLIGLHGYTHQYKSSNSVSGFEFGNEGYNKTEEIRWRVEEAIKTANNINIPYTYWETPHYRTTAEQQTIFEEYFKILYEPAIGIYNSKIITSENNEVTKYIPTPLGYVEDDTGDEMLNRMLNSDENKEFSLFYHLSTEIKSIDIFVNEEGNIIYKYKEDSPLKKILKTAKNLGYRFSSINEI